MHVLFGVIWRHIDQDGRLNHCRVQAVGVVPEVSNKTPSGLGHIFSCEPFIIHQTPCLCSFLQAFDLKPDK
jgi:hypothetical protein